MVLADIFIPFIITGLAELGDKTQLSVLLLSTKTKKHLQLLLGIVLAFLIVDGIAILFGSFIIDIVPENILKIASGIIFIVFGILVLRSEETEKNSAPYSKNPFISGFVLIFLTEWGDKTQISAGLFAAKYNPAMVLIGVMFALTLLSVLAVYLGKFISGKIEKNLIKNIAGAAFIIIGLLFFF